MLQLLELADWDDVPSTLGDKLLDLYMESQSIDALAILDSEEEFNAGRCLYAARPMFVGGSRRNSGAPRLELVHDVRAEAESFDRRPVLERLDRLGLAGTILRAAIATVPNGGSDIHLETITARLFGTGIAGAHFVGRWTMTSERSRHPDTR